MREGVVARFYEILGKEGVFLSPEILKSYSYDGTTNWVHDPDIVLLPTSTLQVSQILKLANEEKIPLTPRGGGTNVSGGSVPIAGGIVLCMTRMNKVLWVNREELRASVETGIILQDLTARLAQDGLFFPPDPQSFLGATLGGAIAENAGGPSCLKYGVTKQYVFSLEVVLPTGEICCLGGKDLRGMAGYDLLHLIISSEGTLGVATSAELRLKSIPPARKTIMVVYNAVGKAAESVAGVFQNGIIPCKIELLDNWVINSMEDLMSFGLPRSADAVLLFETDGTMEEVESDAEKIVETVKGFDPIEIRVAQNREESDRYWLARRAGFASIVGRAKNVYTEDVTVPIPMVPALIKACRKLSDEHGVPIVILGHAGDGNLHPSVLTDFEDKELYGRSLKAIDGIIEAAIDLGGVLSGEHGIGLEKQKYMKRALEPSVLDLMKGIKSIFDPNNIMNPGKVWE